MYKIKPYSIRQAKKLGVVIKPSKTKNKKIDVFKNGVKVASIGAKGYYDYPTYLNKFGEAIANKRRRLYHLRHANFSHIKGTPSYYASKILW